MLIIEANYAKKVGLPAYSSHQFAVTLRTELTDLSQLEKTTADLYQRLQAAVDSQIVNPGLVPTANGELSAPAPRTASPAAAQPRDDDAWKCSEKQQALIQKSDAEHANSDVCDSCCASLGIRRKRGLRRLTLRERIATQESEHEVTKRNGADDQQD